MDFLKQYGPWAVIAGASEGTGREFARQIAAQGLNLVLIARRQGPLLELAQQLTEEFGIACKTLGQDLTEPVAAQQIIASCEGLEVGLFIANAGSDTNKSSFLDKPIDDWQKLITLNTLTPLQLCHHFAKAMAQRGRGGILLVGSGACHGSGPKLAAYSGTKAFNLRFAEGLWAELEPKGVHVLFYALGRTDTPMLRDYLKQHGLPIPDNLADPKAVAKLGLARLPFGPGADWGAADDEPGPGGISCAERRERVRRVAQMSADIFKPGDAK